MIFHDHNLIIIQINKTGGTSVRKTLLPESPRENQHFPALYYLKKYPVEFNNYFKFAFVRNPWDKVVSQFAFQQVINRQLMIGVSFSQFVNGPVGRPFIPQLDWISIKGKVVVDFIGRFESLQKDYDKLCDQIGFEKKTLEHYNKSNRIHYSFYYDEKTKAKVGQLFAKDIEYFGYEFEEI